MLESRCLEQPRALLYNCRPETAFHRPQISGPYVPQKHYLGPQHRKSDVLCEYSTGSASQAHRSPISKALVVGIDYFGQRGELNGCTKDAKTMAVSLNQAGYLEQNIVILSDDQKRPVSQPTKKNILTALHWLVRDANPHDRLLFYYSGHGRQEASICSVWVHNENEWLYPMDFRRNGTIEEFDIYLLLNRFCPPGVRVTMIIDSRVFC